MKRKSYLQRTAIKPKQPADGRIVFSSFSKPGKQIERAAFKRSRPKMRPPEQGGDPRYLKFVRSLPCCVYGTAAPNHAHHEIGAGRGKGQKAHDHRTMPLSARAHREFHDGTGFCKGWSVEKRSEFQTSEIDRVWAIWLTYRETGVLVEPLREAI